MMNSLNALIDIFACTFVCSFCAAASATDFRRRHISNRVCYGAITIGALLASLRAVEFNQGLVEWNLASFLPYMLGAAVSFSIMFCAWLYGGIGGGDVKMVTALGVLLGLQVVLEVIVVGHLLAASFVGCVAAHSAIARRTSSVMATADRIPSMLFESTTITSRGIPMAGFYSIGVLVAIALN